MFSSKICEILKNTYFEEHLRMAASVITIDHPFIWSLIVHPWYQSQVIRILVVNETKLKFFFQSWKKKKKKSAVYRDSIRIKIIIVIYINNFFLNKYQIHVHYSSFKKLQIKTNCLGVSFQNHNWNLLVFDHKLGLC